MPVVPGLIPTSPSKICSVTRNDSPSETSAGSRYVGSAAPAKTSVVFAAGELVLAPTEPLSASASAQTPKSRLSLTPLPLTFAPFSAPSGGKAQAYILQNVGNRGKLGTSRDPARCGARSGSAWAAEP